MDKDAFAQQLARELLQAACENQTEGMPLAARLEAAAATVLGPHINLPPPPWRRDPESDCDLYEEGPVQVGTTCQTDGHYLCRGCVLNVHRLPDHECDHDPCAFEELRHKSEDELRLEERP